MRTVCGSEFQTVGAEDRKARLRSTETKYIAKIKAVQVFFGTQCTCS